MTLMTDQAVWQQLEAYYLHFKKQDLTRTLHFQQEAAGLSLDYSHNHLDARSLALFIELAEVSGLKSSIAHLIAGESLNLSEQRPAWHTMLRDPKNQSDEVKSMYDHLQSLAVQFFKAGRDRCCACWNRWFLFRAPFFI